MNLAKSLLLIISIPILLISAEVEKGGFKVVTDSSNQEKFTIETSRSLNYGLLGRTDFNKGSTNELFGKTQILQRQEAFFDIKNAINPFKDGMSSQTEFTYKYLPKSNFAYNDS